MVDLTPRKVGRSSLLTPPLAYGGGPLGDPRMPNEVALRTVSAAWDTGVRYFDTAPWYGLGRSERRLGLALSGLGVPRQDYHINTKVGRLLVPEPVRDQSKKTLLPSGGVRTPRDVFSGFRVEYDYSGEAFLKQHNDSLQRLGTSYVDSLVIHDLDYGSASSAEVELALHQLSTNGGGGGITLQRLRETGTIRAIGVGCNMTYDIKGGQGNVLTWEHGRQESLIENIADLVDLNFIVMAGCYTLLETRAFQRLIPLCEHRNISMVIATPFAGGFLAASPKPGVPYMYAEPPPEVVEKAQRMQTICGRHNVELAAAAIQFPLAHPLTACVIPGAKTPEEAHANAKLMRTPVPEDVWRLFKEEGLLASGVPTPSGTPLRSTL